LDSALKQIKQRHVDAVNAMLTPEQRTEHEKLRAERALRGKASEKK
jgi:hypothetical protein